MHHRLALAALLLPLSGCVVPPSGPYGYPQAGYQQPGYPGPYAQQDYAYPGYAYNGGSPTYYDGGVTWPLIFYGGGWGYWDGYHHWHGAPPGVAHHLDERHPGGTGYRPWGGEGGPVGRPVGGFPGGSQGGGFHPGPTGGRPSTPAAAPHSAPPAHPAPERKLPNF